MIKSYDDYCEYMRTAFAPLQPLEILEFCIWCIDRYLPAFGEVIFDGLDSNDRTALASLLDELREAFSNGHLLTATRSQDLQAVLLSFGPHDDVARIEVEPEATDYLGAIWNTLEFCRTGDPKFARGVSESLINTWDYRVEATDEAYSLDYMFVNSQMRRELELQRLYLGSLTRRSPPN